VRLLVAERILNLQSPVNQLSGLLPICCVCKKIRNDEDCREQVESYISKRTETQLSHGYCPEYCQKAVEELACAKKLSGMSSTDNAMKAKGQTKGTGSTKS